MFKLKHLGLAVAAALAAIAITTALPVQSQPRPKSVSLAAHVEQPAKPAAAAVPENSPAPATDQPAATTPAIHAYDQYGTPIPTVAETQPAQPWVRSDGFFNYCYQMTDGSWTTVIAQIAIQPGVYYYAGAIDPATQAPAYAVESQQWCKDNAPQINQ